MESSQTRDQICVSCIGKQILYHWATREVSSFLFPSSIWSFLKSAWLIFKVSVSQLIPCVKQFFFSPKLWDAYFPSNFIDGDSLKFRVKIGSSKRKEKLVPRYQGHLKCRNSLKVFTLRFFWPLSYCDSGCKSVSELTQNHKFSGPNNQDLLITKIIDKWFSLQT